MPSLKYRSAQIQPPCAIEFMKTVGADLHIRPAVPPRKTVTACAIWCWSP